MTRQEHESAMSSLSDKYIEQLAKKDEEIQSLKYDLKQFRLAMSAVGWLMEQAKVRPIVEP